MPSTEWQVFLFQRHPDDDPKETCPGEDFLNQCPESVFKDLSAIVDAVAASPPPEFTGGGMWEAMHDEMSGIFEARTRGPDRRLYRLYCVLEREAPGLGGPSLVIITGKRKPAGKGLSRSDYTEVRRLANEYFRRTPRRVV